MMTIEPVDGSPDCNLILASLDVGVIALSPDSTIVYVNPSAAEQLGYTVDELYGAEAGSTFHRMYKDGRGYPFEESPIFASIRDGAATRRDDEVFWRKDGGSFPVGYTSTPLRSAGQVTGAVVAFRDLTTRRQIEAKLIDSERRYRALFNHVNDPIFAVDPQTGRILDCNEKACEMEGRSREELVGMAVAELHPPEEREQLPERFREVIEKGSITGITGVHHESKDGTLIPVEVSAAMTELEGRKINISVVRDVTKQRQLEEEQRRGAEELVDSEVKYRSLVASANDAIFVADVDTGRIIEANQRAEDLLGRPLAEIIGMHQSQLHPSDKAQEYIEIFAREVAKRRGIVRDVYVERKDGSLVPVEISASVSEIGGRLLLQGIFHDVSDRKAAEDALRSSREALRSTLASMDDIVFSFDRDGRYVDFYQPEMEGELYLPPSLFLGKDFRSVGFPEEVVEHIERSFTALRNEEGTQAFDYMLPMGDEERWYNAKISARTDSEGNFEGATAVIRDITVRKEAEDKAARLAEESRLLLDVSQIIGGALRLEEIMARLVEVAASLTGLGRATVMLADEAGELRPQASTDSVIVERRLLRGNIEVVPFAPRTMSNLSAAHGPFIDVPADMKSIILVPFCHGGDCLGTLILDEPGREVEFSTRQVRMAESIARQATLAIQNARAYETQATIAETLGRSLLPDHAARLEGLDLGMRYVSATEGALIGGDFYDYFQLADGRAVVALGDVSGKGLEAAIDTAMVKYALEALASLDPAPGDLVEALNNALAGRFTAGRFATLFYALIDTGMGTVVFSNAGHPPPLLRRPDGSCLPLETTMTGGTALGIIGGRKYGQKEFKVDPGDLLVLYTDGVTEARSSADRSEMFDIDNIVAVLSQAGERSAEEWAQALYSAVEDYSGGNLTDDVAILTLLVR